MQFDSLVGFLRVEYRLESVTKVQFVLIARRCNYWLISTQRSLLSDIVRSVVSCLRMIAGHSEFQIRQTNMLDGEAFSRGNFSLELQIKKFRSTNPVEMCNHTNVEDLV